jgi:hypothetical protein
VNARIHKTLGCRAVDECLQLRPVAMAAMRLLAHRVTLAGRSLEPGTVVMPPSLLLHRTRRSSPTRTPPPNRFRSAIYELLSHIAQRAGDAETAEMARRILPNERETAEKLRNLGGCGRAFAGAAGSYLARADRLERPDDDILAVRVVHEWPRR